MYICMNLLIRYIDKTIFFLYIYDNFNFELCFRMWVVDVVTKSLLFIGFIYYMWTRLLAPILGF